MGRAKRIWYLSPFRAAKVQASLRIRAVSPEPPLLAHTSSESRETFRQKARALAPLNGWACAVKICHDGMLEDTNSPDGAHIVYTSSFCFLYCVVSVLQQDLTWPGHARAERATHASKGWLYLSVFTCQSIRQPHVKASLFYVVVAVCVCVNSGLTSLSTIFQSYHDGVWLWQGAQCSLL